MPSREIPRSNPYKTKEFSGYYAYLIKNIGKKNQFVARFDYFDPNTRLSGDDAGKDVYYKRSPWPGNIT